MEYTKLGKTDMEISKVCVGCMSFGKALKRMSAGIRS